MAWYLAPALAVGRSEVNTRWPNRDKTSDGTIGDAAHQATRSDHNPNSRESVDAWDMDKDGVDVWAVIRAFERHPSSHYWIYNRQIADRDNGWEPVPYNGPNPHTAHVHFSIRQSAAAEQDRRPWGLLPEEEDVTLNATQDARLRNIEVYGNAMMRGVDATGLDNGSGTPVTIPNALARKMEAVLSAVAAVDSEVAERLAAQFDEIDAELDAAGSEREALAAAVEAVPERTAEALREQPASEAAAAVIATVGAAHAQEIAEQIMAQVTAQGSQG